MRAGGDERYNHLLGSRMLLNRISRTRSRGGYVLAAIGIGMLILIISQLQLPLSSKRIVRERGLPYDMTRQSPESVPLNSTLGFEKIFAIGLDKRVDKKEELLLLAHMSGLDSTLR